ncbi:hypothetical protein EDC01DRAFT_116698 [Geopyxis carbonaria]|nr:hypothetical protein EDC01DRAFT_116698 [Geopyxis carbonaria]
MTTSSPPSAPPSPSALATAIFDNTFASLSDAAAVKLFHAAFAKELTHLQNASATVESSGCTPTAGDGAQTPSQLLYGTDYVEVNRTLVGMLAYKWLLADDYASFTACQGAAIRLSRPSFSELRALLDRTLPEPADRHLLLIAMVVNDLGKDPTLFQSHSGENHDQLVLAAARAGRVPSLAGLSSEHADLLLAGLEFGAALNIAQLAQAETVPAALAAARALADRPRAFNIKFAEVLLDVAGAAGHVDTRGAKAMNQPVYIGFRTAHGALQRVISGAATLRAAYDCILEARAQLAGVPTLKVTVPAERALLRLLAMGRVDAPATAAVFQRAFDALKPDTKKALVDGLSVDGVDDGVAVLPYYMPAVLSEGLKNADDAQRAVGAMMRFLARVYGGSRPAPGSKGGVLERNLAFAKETVQGEKFRGTPEVLDKVELPWEKEAEGKGKDGKAGERAGL